MYISKCSSKGMSVFTWYTFFGHILWVIYAEFKIILKVLETKKYILSTALPQRRNNTTTDYFGGQRKEGWRWYWEMLNKLTSECIKEGWWKIRKIFRRDFKEWEYDLTGKNVNIHEQKIQAFI